MNKRQKEVIQAQLDSEKAVLERLEKQYQAALNDINRKIRILQSDEMTQSKIYRLEYQKALKKQVEAILEKLHGDEFSTIQEYLSSSYTDAFVGTMYDIAGQGIPLIIPLDQAAAVKAILTDSKISKSLYESLGVDTNNLKKAISAEVTRGIATGMSYHDIARNISNVSAAPMSRAKTIARTEGHRIQQASTMDAQKEAKGKGADVVKQWDSTLDGKTRKNHRELDGQIREVDEPYEIGGKKAMAPGYFNNPAEDCNCRCVSLTRARWALDEDELKTMKDRAAYFGLDKTKNFDDFKKKYLKAAEQVKAAGSASMADVKDFDALDKYLKTAYNISVDNSVKSLDFENVRSALTGVESVFTEFHGLSDAVKEITTSKSGVMSCTGEKITFNPKFFTEHEKMLESCKANAASHWWVANASTASIGAHESAHAVEWMMIQSSGAYGYNWQKIDAWNKCTEAKKLVSQACKNIKKTAYGKGKKNAELISSISRYAQDTASETMAEAFADVYANGENANPLSLEIKRLTVEALESYKGGKVQ